MHFLPYVNFFHNNSLTLSNDVIFHCQAFLKKVKKALQLLKVQKQIFDDEKPPRTNKNPKICSKKHFLSDLVIKRVNLLVFIKIL